VDRPPPASLAGRIAEAGGAVPFEKWMELALHDPDVGYYARNIRDVGARGDFATASTLHPALGEAVAAWAAVRRRALGGPLARWNLVEAGPGTGALAETVLRALPLLARRTVRLHLVETSPVLRAAQRERLGHRAAWHATLEGALAACGGRAVVYASELLDAFPVRVLRRRDGGWEELEISLSGRDERERGERAKSEEREKREEREERDGTKISLNVDEWREEWRPAASERLGPDGAFSALSRPWTEGQRVEIAPAVRSLFLSRRSPSSPSPLVPSSTSSSSLSSLTCGSLLLLDYGDTIDNLYLRRPNGTVRGYAHHQRLEGPDLYRWGGKADVTADVNFTDVAAWAAQAGFAAAPLETQGAFLARHVAGAEARAAREPALAFLLDPRGAGAGFKALELRKG
jgi:SAM-dependent MidA family methyltransferase